MNNTLLALPLYHALLQHGTENLRGPLLSARRLDLEAIRSAVETYDNDAQDTGRDAFRSFPTGAPLASPWTRWYGEWTVPTAATDLTRTLLPGNIQDTTVTMQCGSLVDSLHLVRPNTNKPSYLWFMLTAFLADKPEVRAQLTTADYTRYESVFHEAARFETLGDLTAALPAPLGLVMTRTVEATRWILTFMHFSRVPGMSLVPFVNGAAVVLLNRSGHVFPIADGFRSFWGSRIPGPRWCGLPIIKIPQGRDGLHMLALHHKVLTHTLMTTHSRHVVLGDVLPTRQERRAAVHDHTLSPISYTILAIPSISAPSGQFPVTVTQHHAVHIRRGHFKSYTRGRGLFGRYHGVFWWDEQSNVGTAPRIRIKDYLVRPID